MSVVLDASITLTWLFEDEGDTADALFDQIVEAGAHVPSLWLLEVANALQLAVRRKRIDVAYRDYAIDRLRVLPIAVDPHAERHAWFETLQLADRFNLTVYDAAYLELARRLALPLATRDRALAEATRAVGLDTLGL